MKLHSSPMRKSSAFTLIEVLVVIGIIAILAALLLSISGGVQETAGRKRAETEVQAITSALEKYKLEYGTYPDGDGGDNSTRVLIEDLMTKPMEEKRQPFMTFSGRTLSNQDSPETGYLVDPFGNPYRYEFPGQEDRSGTNFFDLWSQGRKNSSDEDTWIKNW